MKQFESFVHGILGNPKKQRLTIVLTLLAFFGSVMMLPTGIVLAKMLPGKSANTFSIYTDTPVGSSIQQTEAVTQCVARELQKEAEVTDVEIYLGMGSPLDYAGLVKGSAFKRGEHEAEIVVNLSDKHGRDETSFEMVQRLRPVLHAQCTPLVDGTSIKMIEQPAGPPTLASIVIELYGEDEQGLRELSGELAALLANTEGLVDVDVMLDELYTTYELVPNEEKIIKSGLSVAQVNQILYLAFEGMAAAIKNSKNQQDQIPLFVTLSKETKSIKSLGKEPLRNKLSSLKLMNQKGMLVPMTEVVELRESVSNPTRMTKNLRRYVNIIAETDMVSQVYPLLDARSSILETFSERYDIESTELFNYRLTDKQSQAVYDLKFDGEMKVTMDTFADLGTAFIAALVLIFLLMVVYYKSFVLSSIVLLGSFLSIIGVIVGHWVWDLFTTHTFFLTATSLIGFIALMGISSRNSLLLIDFTKSLMQDRGMDKHSAISVATATRAKPIFLTAAAIMLASLMLASDPVFGGLGVALIFGTLAAVVVSLLFVPVLLMRSELSRHFAAED
jgi:multidrug efflux pump subunit AcrB